MAQSSFPNIDFDALGSVGVAGSFSGVQLWNQSLSTQSTANTFNASAATLISRANNGTLTKINATEAGGAIDAICQFTKSPGLVFVGGLFQRIGDTSVSNVASYNPDTKQWDDLVGGVDGRVQALYCDESNDQVLVGGEFRRPSNDENTRYLGGVASWSTTDNAWAPVLFGGLNGTVNTIVPGANSSLVRFGGSFGTEFSANLNGSTSGTNTSASSLTSALAPISLGMSEFTGGPASSQAGFSDPAQILCPQGPDGAGNSYLFADGSDGRLTVRAFRAMEVRAIRLGNTFQEGRGTRTFSIFSIPDNTNLELLYLDPTTNRNVTCTNNCTLFHDPSIPYQDFLIADTPANNAPNGTKLLTGIEFTALDSYGAGSGLHILELLSEGGWAYAYEAFNRGACNSTEPGVNGTTSFSTNQGGWYQSTAVRLSGTVDPVLALTDEYSNLAANTDAQVAWNVDIPVDGNYSVYLFVPGCQASGQCGQRTDVVVTVINNSTNQGTSTRVSEVVEQDTSVLVYNGEIQKSSANFGPSVVLSIPADAPAPSDGTEFTVIADKVIFQLRNSNETTMILPQRGFGVLEYNLFDAGVQTTFEANGTGILPNSTMTALDRFSATLYKQGVHGNESEYVTSIASLHGKTFVAGSFRSVNFTANTGFANIVSYTDQSDGNNATRLFGGGLNALVSSLTVVGDFLYVGGNFTGSADNSSVMNYIARYDPDRDAWAALGGGPNGPVTSLHPLGDHYLLVTGDFDSLNGTGLAGGYAVWDTSVNAWQRQGAFLSGEITASAATSDTAVEQSYLAGSVSSLSSNGAPGVVALDPPAKGSSLPMIDPLNFTFSTSSSSAGASSASGVGRSATRRRSVGQRKASRSGVSPNAQAGLAARLLGAAAAILPRSSASMGPPGRLVKRVDAMNPTSLASSGANEVLASAFWERDDGVTLTIVGGNFTTNSGITNLGVYDPNANALQAFPPVPTADENNSEQLSVIRALFVEGDTLYAGGDGGLETYDLKAGKWNDNFAALQARNGSLLSVTSINHRPDSNTIIVSGNFDQAGSLPCESICSWDSVGLRWVPMGSGIQGAVSALDFAGVSLSLFWPAYLNRD